jgi:hypothetical protein
MSLVRSPLLDPEALLGLEGRRLRTPNRLIAGAVVGA